MVSAQEPPFARERHTAEQRYQAAPNIKEDLGDRTGISNSYTSWA
jgi:hypothetical protein